MDVVIIPVVTVILKYVLCCVVNTAKKKVCVVRRLNDLQVDSAIRLQSIWLPIHICVVHHVPNDKMKAIFTSSSNGFN